MKVMESLALGAVVITPVALVLFGLWLCSTLNDYLSSIASSLRGLDNSAEDWIEEQHEEAPRPLTLVQSHDDGLDRLDFVDLLWRTRGEAGRPRLQVMIEDWGDQAYGPEMRFRWVLLDADREILRKIGEPADALGVGIPYTLGNAPTWAQAHAEALSWAHGHGYLAVAAEVPLEAAA